MELNSFVFPAPKPSYTEELPNLVWISKNLDEKP